MAVSDSGVSTPQTCSNTASPRSSAGMAGPDNTGCLLLALCIIMDDNLISCRRQTPSPAQTRGIPHFYEKPPWPDIYSRFPTQALHLVHGLEIWCAGCFSNGPALFHRWRNRSDAFNCIPRDTRNCDIRRFRIPVVTGGERPTVICGYAGPRVTANPQPVRRKNPDCRPAPEAYAGIKRTGGGDGRSPYHTPCPRRISVCDGDLEAGCLEAKEISHDQRC